MKKILSFLICLLWSANVYAAVGCDLNDPDRDVKRFFPNSTGYKTEYLSVEKAGGKELYNQMENELGDNFSGIYEKIDVPYTLYTVLDNETPVGYIHGVNQKGKYGGMQVFLTTDTKGIITNFYFQKLTSKNAKRLRSSDFGNQFVGLSLADFKDYDVQTGQAKNGSKINAIRNPAPESSDDFYAALRGVKKNLILMQHFIFDKQEQK
ncbi:MAG: hypothetical protein IJ689_08055 [Alphaproteobacteria bacterium]|nr:hypothetical protein [Alphaproteobacteria bacterium]MBR1649528.1 hypothetical protein [Alphaproteobacteria bacterium]